MYSTNFISITIAFLFCTFHLSAQLTLCESPSIELLKDINDLPFVHPLNNTSIVHNGKLYYTFDDGIHGQELWVSDHTEQGTMLLEDIYPGSVSSGIEDMILINGKLFFKADKGIHGCELYFIDLGAPQLTATLVKDILPGANGSCPQDLIEVNGELFFTAYDPSTGRELWASDGTANGTRLVKDIDEMESSSQMDYFFSGLGKLFFTVDQSNTGEELWVSDGTSNGTHLLRDIYPGTQSFTRFSELNLIEFDNAVFFRAQTALNQTALWKTDGSTNGTIQLQHDANAHTNFQPRSLTVIGNQLLLRGNKSIFGDPELFVTDGNQVSLLKDINVGQVGSNPSQFLNVDGTLFFRANDGIHGSELWKSDGTALGTQLVKDITPNGSSTIQSMTDVNGLAFFFIEKSDSSTELWKSGGSDATTLEIYNFTDNHEDIETFEAGSQFYFIINTDQFGEELWRSNGESNSTGILEDIAQGSASSAPQNFRIDKDNGRVYFFAHAELTGMQLYTVTSDNPISFLGEKSNFGEHSRGINARLETKWGNNAVLNINKLGTEDVSYWISDGTKNGTYEANFGNLNLGHRTSFVDVGSHFLFIYQDDNDDFRLMQSDGTQSGTSLLTNFGNINYAFLNTSIGNKAIFYKFENDEVSVWSVSPNSQPVLMVGDLGVFNLEEEWVSNLFYDEYYFFFNQSIEGLNMWKTDGTPSGTIKIHTFDDVVAQSAYAFNDKIIILTYSSSFSQRSEKNEYGKTSLASGSQVWVSDGNLNGTNMMFELDPNLTILNSITLSDRIVFSATTGGPSGRGIHVNPDGSMLNSGNGMWSTDGTANGTFQLQEIESPAILNTVSDQVFFTSSSFSGSAQKLYSTNGTISGTTEYEFEFDSPYNIVDDRLNQEFLSSLGGQAIFSNILGCQGLETYVLDEQGVSLNILNDLENYNLDPSESLTPISLGDKTIVLLNNKVTGSELYTIDCACQEELYINDAHMESGKYNALREISIMAQSRPASDLILKAGKSVEFNRGSTIGNSNEVTLTIETCNH